MVKLNTALFVHLKLSKTTFRFVSNHQINNPCMYQSVLFVNVLSKDLSHLNIKVIITTSTILLEIIAKHLKFLYVSNLSAYDETDDEILDPSYLMGVSNTK